MENEVLKNIKERRSVRRFKQEQLSDEDLHTVLEAGTWAPTGMGTQAPFIVAIQDEAQKTTLSKINAVIMVQSQILSTVHRHRSMSLPRTTMPTMSRTAASSLAR